MNEIPSPYYTPEEAAAVLRVALRTVYGMVRAGELPAKRIGATGRIYRIPKHAIDPGPLALTPPRRMRRIA